MFPPVDLGYNIEIKLTIKETLHWPFLLSNVFCSHKNLQEHNIINLCHIMLQLRI